VFFLPSFSFHLDSAAVHFRDAWARSVCALLERRFSAIFASGLFFFPLTQGIVAHHARFPAAADDTHAHAAEQGDGLTRGARQQRERQPAGERHAAPVGVGGAVPHPQGRPDPHLSPGFLKKYIRKGTKTKKKKKERRRGKEEKRRE
jgi:hypothetical protein